MVMPFGIEYQPDRIKALVRITMKRRRSLIGEITLSRKTSPLSCKIGIGDYKIVTTLCPGGKERMRRLMEMVRYHRVDLTPLITHRFSLDEIGEAYKVFGERQDRVVKVAIKP